MSTMRTLKNCPVACACKRGVYFRVSLSRLEEGLGHVGYRCDACGDRVKVIPDQRGAARI